MKVSVRAAELASLLDQAPPGIKCLSLDCFDTLIWRNVNRPTDVFADLGLPGGADMRAWGEEDARRAAVGKRTGGEVTIEEIYATLMPAADQAARDAAIAIELAAEARHCFGFAPTRDLIVEARARGLQVVIVSDTYLDEAQLRALIAAAAGDDVAAMIDRIFCSSTYGVSKGGGLFVHVLPELGLSPKAILHVGDNPVADQDAPQKLGINTAHLVQFDTDAIQRLRLEAAAAAILDPDARATVPVYQPHRPAVSLRMADDAEYAVGHDVMGPLMHGFVGWVHDEAMAMEERLGAPPKLLFLLRDGHLPARAFRARYPELANRVAEVEISRFTARAASLADEEAIRDYITPRLGAGEWKVLARQLLFFRDEIEKLGSSRDAEEFERAILRPSNVQKIVHRSRQFAQRMAAHLKRHGVEPGDAVMLVDLGYNGSVQNTVEPTLRRTLNLNIAGRYLLLREMTLTGLDKRGWLDVRHYDMRMLHGLSESIAIVEQLCTLAQGSVVNYKDDGTPVREALGVKGMQSSARDRAQAAAIDFIEQGDRGFVRPPVSDTADARRQNGAAALTRLLFLPMASEVALFERFDHDANLGTREMIRMIDPDAAAAGLRQRGLFYTKNATRMYLPGELQRHGLPINLSLLTARRFGLDLRKTDFDVGGIKLAAIIADNREQALIDVEAFPTHDGYYSVLVPVGEGRFTVCLPLGQNFDFVQIDHIGFVNAHTMLKSEGARAKPIAAQPLYDNMEEVAPGLFRTGGDAGLLVVPPPSACPKGASLVLNIVFRPIVARGAATGAQQKAA